MEGGRKLTQPYLEARDNVAALFEPQSVAVIGSLRESWFGGYTLIKDLLDFGFQGRIYPVNPVGDTVLGMKVYPSIGGVAQPVDLVVIMTSGRAVPGIIQQCAEAGVKAALIVSDGFAERDQEGARLQREIVGIARRSGMRILGPNTVGVVNTAVGLIISAYELDYRGINKGAIAVCGQTGLISPRAMPFEDMQYGISKICDFGNKCDIDEIDLLEYLGRDPQTKVITMHLEDVKDGRAFLEKAKEVVAAKPVLILKPGRSRESRKALASHTGSLAGEDHIYDSAFKQAGVLRVNTFGEMTDLAKIFALQPLPAGNRLAVIAFSGGAGVMAVDAAVESGLTLATLSRETLERLARISPLIASNPLDVGPPAAMVGDAFLSHYPEIIEAVLKDDNVDCAHVGFQTSQHPMGLSVLVELVSQLRGRISKPIAIWVCGPSLPANEEAVRNLEALGFPAYLQNETAVKALGAVCKYAGVKARISQPEADS